MNSELIADFKSPRTKCIAFHPSKPIVLTSHHTSEIHAYDLHLLRQIFTFQGHDGPVRSIAFHHTSDIFISGGDDCKIILWSYSKKKVLKIFKGHTDYIRSLDFHPQNPWFLSTSDDQSIKVWNFQSYKLLSTITGHSHYVMCAKFFNNHIISCSLDQTIRVWDYEGLNKRKESNLIGVPNIIVKQIIDAHDRGINSLYVHKTKHIFLSCGDDREVKVWQMGDSVYEKEVYYSHSNNVTGCVFVNEKVVSVGEDGYLCIEGGEKKKSDTRLWCVATDKDERYFAVGYDSGVMIYKTQERKEVYCFDGEAVFYCKEGKIYVNNMKEETVVFKTKKEVTCIKCVKNCTEGVENKDNMLLNNTYSNCVLVQYATRFDVIRNKEIVCSGDGKGMLMQNGIVSLYNHEVCLNDNKLLTCDTPADLFSCDNTSFFIVKKKCVDLFDIQAKKVIFTWNISDIKKIIVGYNSFALIGARKIVINSRSTNTFEIYEELTEVKDGFFEKDCFVYSTVRHIKYIYNGTKGLLRSMEKEVSVLFMKDEYVFYMHRNGIENVRVNVDGMKIIQGVHMNDDKMLLDTVKHSKLLSDSTINYIIQNKKGHLVSDYLDETKTDLLMEIGKLEECYSNIKDKGDFALYESLYARCIANNNLLIAEKCLWKMKDYTRLFYLFLCSNQIVKLETLKEYGKDSFKINLGIILGDDEYVKRILYKKKIIGEMNTFGKIKEKYNIKNKLNKHNQKNEEEAEKQDNSSKTSTDPIKPCVKEVSENKKVQSKTENENDNDESRNMTEEQIPSYKTDNKQSVVSEKPTALQINDSEEEIALKHNTKLNSEHKEKSDTFPPTQTSKSENESFLDAPRLDSLSHSDLSNNSAQVLDNGSKVENAEHGLSPNQKLTDQVEAIHFITVYDKKLVKTELVTEDMDYDSCYEEALNHVTSGKFSNAISIFRNLINTIAFNLVKDDELVPMRTKVGNYLSGILIEKRKKKVKDPQNVLIMSSYFPSLEIEPVHKNLALSNFMVQCYKNGNFSMAKDIAQKITTDQNTEKMVKKVLNSSKEGNAVNIDEGIFCFDTATYENECLKCKFCFVSSKNGAICSCCEIGVLE